MKRKPRRAFLPVMLFIFALLCRLSPGFAGLWARVISLRALALLHRLTARVPFPVLEPLALVWAALALPPRRRGFLRRAGALILAAFAGYLLLWYPLYWTGDARTYPEPGAPRLEALCGRLIDRLNDAQPRFPAPEEILEAASADGHRVKAARYPEWMGALGVGGLFSPWTGEAIVDASIPAPLLPFTAAHELAHLAGVADEGMANIAAWQSCVARGGAFADSARLWALKYAMAALRKEDAAAWKRMWERMEPRLSDLLSAVGGEPIVREGFPAAILGIAGPTGSYDGLVGWLAGGGEDSSPPSEGRDAVSSHTVRRSRAAASRPAPIRL